MPLVKMLSDLESKQTRDARSISIVGLSYVKSVILSLLLFSRLSNTGYLKQTVGLSAEGSHTKLLKIFIQVVASST